MGQRANLVIVERGKWKLYYDHWCANRLHIELFWGPDIATEYIEQRQPCVDREDWLDEVWCEGGAIVDYDRKVLVWYGGEDILNDIPLRRAFLLLLGQQWRDWEVRWAHEGIVEIGTYLGFPPGKFLVDRLPDAAEAAVRLLDEYPEDNNLLLTLRRGGITLAARAFGTEESLELGVEQFPILEALCRSEHIEWTGGPPTIGLHIDSDKQSISYWYAHPREAIEERVGRGWPGWNTKWLKDRYEEQLLMSDDIVRLQISNEVDLQRSLIEHLRLACEKRATNPAADLAPRIGATGINPRTNEARGSVGLLSAKLLLLDALEATLASGSSSIWNIPN
jgi:hypothetical protein